MDFEPENPNLGMMQKYGPLAAQFLRFAVIGAINTGLDFAILNLLMYLTGVYSGPTLVILNFISFTIAVINSYFLNKKWAFKDQANGDQGRKFVLFIVISLIGALINTGIVAGGTTYIPPMLGLSKELWANVMKLAATGASLVWNFIGYKLFVFRGK
jgi:putative flippase GtrA